MATDPIKIPTTIPETKAAAQALLDQLWAANPTNLADSETVSDTIAALNAVLTQLNQEDWASRTGSMQAAAADLKDPLTQLNTLQAQLEGVAKRVGTLENIAKDVASLVSGCQGILKG